MRKKIIIVFLILFFKEVLPSIAVTKTLAPLNDEINYSEIITDYSGILPPQKKPVESPRAFIKEIEDLTIMNLPQDSEEAEKLDEFISDLLDAVTEGELDSFEDLLFEVEALNTLSDYEDSLNDVIERIEDRINKINEIPILNKILFLKGIEEIINRPGITQKNKNQLVLILENIISLNEFLSHKEKISFLLSLLKPTKKASKIVQEVLGKKVLGKKVLLPKKEVVAKTIKKTTSVVREKSSGHRRPYSGGGGRRR